MNPTRTGKIARLPKAIRDELNQRLLDGDSAAVILDWLREFPEVEDVLFKYFNCRPITPQNISEWRHGGHQDWLQEQKTLAFAGQLVERSTNLAEQSGHQRLPDHFATLLATEFIQLAQTMLNEQQDTKQRWDCLGQIQDRLSRLRRDDHRAIHAAIHHQRWTRQFKTEDAAAAQAADTEERRQHITRYRILRSGELNLEEQFLGGDDLAHDIAAMSLEERHNLEFGMLGRHSEDFARPRHPDEHKYPWRRPWEKRTAQTDAPDAHPTPASAEIQPPTAQSNPTMNPAEPPNNATPPDPSDMSDQSDVPTTRPTTDHTPSLEISANPTLSNLSNNSTPPEIQPSVPN